MRRTRYGNAHPRINAMAVTLDARTMPRDLLIEEVARVIFAGGTIIFPHDTSYGLACDPLRLDAVDRIYLQKRRPDHKPLTLHVAGVAELLEYAPGNVVAAAVAKRLLPGPVTLLVARPSFISEEITAGHPTLGVRVPDEPLARAILDRCGPLAVSSANASGDPPYRGRGGIERLPAADLLVENGPTRYDGEAAIVDCTRERPLVLREGTLGFELIEARLGIAERHVVKARR